MRVPGSFTLTHRAVFMLHFVSGWKCIIAIRYRSETVSKFSHRAPAPPSSCTPALAPTRRSPRPSPKKPPVSGHHNLSCAPTELRLPVRCPPTCRDTASPEPRPAGRGHPRPRTAPRHVLCRDPRPSPLPRDPAGGRSAAAVLWGSARPGQGTASPRPGTTDTDTHTHVTHTQNTRPAPVRYHRRGANSHPGSSGLRSPRRDQHRDPAARAEPSDNRSPLRCG